MLANPRDAKQCEHLFGVVVVQHPCFWLYSDLPQSSIVNTSASKFPVYSAEKSSAVWICAGSTQLFLVKYNIGVRRTVVRKAKIIVLNTQKSSGELRGAVVLSIIGLAPQN